jgi:hypothetical protein
VPKTTGQCRSGCSEPFCGAGLRRSGPDETGMCVPTMCPPRQLKGAYRGALARAEPQPGDGIAFQRTDPGGRFHATRAYARDGHLGLTLLVGGPGGWCRWMRNWPPSSWNVPRGIRLAGAAWHELASGRRLSRW